MTLLNKSPETLTMQEKITIASNVELSNKYKDIWGVWYL